MIPPLISKVASKALATVVIPIFHYPKWQRFSATSFLVLFRGEKEHEKLIKENLRFFQRKKEEENYYYICVKFKRSINSGIRKRSKKMNRMSN